MDRTISDIQKDQALRTVFLDEGALDGKHRYPSVCAVVVDDAESVHKAIEQTIHKLALRGDFRLEKAADGFRERGFHHVDDPLVARQEFLRLIPRLDVEWWCASNLLPHSDPYDSLPAQFEWLLEKILKKAKNKRLKFVFEQNARLNSLYPRIVQNSIAKAGYDHNLVRCEIGDKSVRALSIADYCIAVCTEAITVWRQLCCNLSGLQAKHEYRTYAHLEPACSVLFASNIRKSLSSRSSRRLIDHSYFEVTGKHNKSCDHFDTNHV